MIVVKCIEKIKDNKGVIKQYKIKDSQCNEKVVTAQQLKQAIKNGQVCCSNLKLTSDNRLVGNIEEQVDIEKKLIKIRALGKTEFDYDNMTFVVKGENILLKSVNIENGTITLPSFMTGYMRQSPDKVGMYSPFEKCVKIKVINKSQITIMTHLFQYTVNLEEIDLSDFNASQITSLRQAFRCSAVKRVHFGKFNTEQVTDMSGLFESCENLVSADISKFNTKNVISMIRTFSNTGLKSIDLSNWDMRKVIDITYMFENSIVEKIKMGTTSPALRTMWGTFSQCIFLSSVDLSKLNTKGVDNMCKLFTSCTALKKLDLSNFSVEKVLTMDNMFSYCGSIKELDLSSFYTLRLNNMSEMFLACENLKVINMDNFCTQGIKSCGRLFWKCKSLTSIVATKRFIMPAVKKQITEVLKSNTNQYDRHL